MSIYKRGEFYWYKFMWHGELIRESTKQGNDKVARNMESARRAALAQEQITRENKARELDCKPKDLIRCLKCEKIFNGAAAIVTAQGNFCGEICRDNWEREHKHVPTLCEYLEKDFVPFVMTKHAAKPATVEYYSAGARMLTKSDVGALRIDKVTDQHAQQFAAQHVHYSASYVNRALRTLRRALNLAFEWGKLERPIKIHLAKGERQRDRVLALDEVERYLDACPQPWRDCATIIVEEGMRPGEVFALKWPHVLLNDNGGLIRIVEGKSKAARRILPMTPRVLDVFRERFEAQGRPIDGWIFPSASRQGHVNHNTTRGQHEKAFAILEQARKQNPGLPKIEPFEPYVLRHTALTRLAEAGADVYALAKIAGHSTILITQRYIHEGADAIERAFSKREEQQKALVSSDVPTKVGTKLGTA